MDSTVLRLCQPQEGQYIQHRLLFGQSRSTDRLVGNARAVEGFLQQPGLSVEAVENGEVAERILLWQAVSVNPPRVQ